MTPTRINNVMMGIDAAGDLKDIQVNVDGQIIPETLIPGATYVRKGQTGTIPASTTVGINWVIPAGKTFILDDFCFGAYVPTGESLLAKAELIWQPNGNSVGEELISVLFLQSQSHTIHHFKGLTYPGDGTARMRVEITNKVAQPIDVEGQLEGCY